jgi:hypothetical protein
MRQSIGNLQQDPGEELPQHLAGVTGLDGCARVPIDLAAPTAGGIRPEWPGIWAEEANAVGCCFGDKGGEGRVSLEAEASRRRDCDRDTLRVLAVEGDGCRLS